MNHREVDVAAGDGDGPDQRFARALELRLGHVQPFEALWLYQRQLPHRPTTVRP